MSIRRIEKKWHRFGLRDPLWAVLSWKDKKNKQWDPKAFFLHGQEEIDAVIQMLQHYTPETPYNRVLDFGCGVGRVSQAFLRYADSVDGVDIAESMIAEANRYNKDQERCRYHLNTSTDLRMFTDSSFNIVYSVITLQHMHPKYMKKYIAEFLRVLTPNGVAVFQIPTQPKRLPPTTFKGRLRLLMPAWIMRIYVRMRYVDNAIMDMYGLPPEEVERIVAAHGGRIVHSEPNDYAGVEWESKTYLVQKVPPYSTTSPVPLSLEPMASPTL